MNFWSPCVFSHSRDWTYIRIGGQLTRACSRCLQPVGAILVNSESQAIVPAKVPPIVPLRAVKAKRKKSPSKSLRFPRSA